MVKDEVMGGSRFKFQCGQKKGKKTFMYLKKEKSFNGSI